MLFENVEKIEKETERQVKVQKAKNEAVSALTDCELERLENLEKLEPKKDQIAKMQANIESKRILQAKAWTFDLSAKALAILSALMTVAGITGTQSLFDFKSSFTGHSGIFGITVATLQLVLLNFNKRAYEIQQCHYSDYKKMRLYQIAIISVSVAGNYKYLSGTMPSYGFFSCIIAVSLDLGNMFLSNLASNVRYRIYSNSELTTKNRSIIEKLIVIKFGHWIAKVNQEYDSVMSELQKQTPKTKVTTDKQRDSEKPSKVVSDLSGIVEKVKKMQPGTTMNKDTFGLTQYDWKLARKKLEDMKLVFCKNKCTYRSEYMEPVGE